MEDRGDRELILRTIEQMLDLQLRSVRQLLGEEPLPKRRRRSGRRRQSLVDQSIEVLTENRRPMHVSELVEVLRQRYERITDRDALSSALAKKARRGILLRQCAPATFELRQAGEDTQ